MRFFRIVALALAVAVACFGAASPACGQPPLGPPYINTPNGNPTGPASARSPTYWNPLPYYYVVSLSPGQATTAQPWPDSISLNDILGAQGFTPANGWTIDRFNVQGTMTLNAYLAYTEAQPAYAGGTLNFGGQNVSGSGGAELGLSFAAQGTDPTGADMHWLQVIHTNAPGANQWGRLDVGNGDSWYIDDNLVQNLAAQGPFYGSGGFGNATDFFDAPARPYANNTSLDGVCVRGRVGSGIADD